ncbi:MerR family transcriptional regulator [Vibrio sp. DW001]|uniref:MerR family transcriptional regulator n=1 Tax=Vibrio sp. DW001 TaxID=2912315 RepID=UPI0023B11B43|nr:MerR family transcriptional regulator [Vibrio sp. DW001]WED29713.1 MerR family transcriptional regulator [Vibrio sp. DW001]
MLTVMQLAKKFEISRTAILYYEREGLLEAVCRTASGYRQYGPKEVERLQCIMSYRSFGVSVRDILPLLDNQNTKNREQILRNQFTSLGQEIQKLRQQQASVVAILKDPSLLSDKPMTKDQWTDVLRASGLDEEGMVNWHIQFEKIEPEGHQTFLKSLGIEASEIRKIRTWSKKQNG